MKRKLVAVVLMLTLLSATTVLAINMTNQNERTVLEDVYDQGGTVLEDVYGSHEFPSLDDSEVLPSQNDETVMENVYGTQSGQPQFPIHGANTPDSSSLIDIEGTWTNQNGIISVNQTNDAKAYLNGSNYDNLEFTADVMMGNDSSTSDAGIFFRASDISTGTNALKGYYVGIDAVGDRLLLGRLNNSWTGLSYIPMTINANQYYKLYVVAVDNNIKVYVDDVLKIDITDTSPILTAGYIGLRANKTTASYRQVQCNNVSILSITSGTWNTSYNPVSYSSTQGQDNKAQLYGYNYSDLEFSAQVKVGRDNASSDAGLIFRASNVAAGTNAMKGYYAGIDANKQRVILGKLNNGWSMLGEVNMDISANQNYKITVKAVGSSIKIYVDNVLKIDCTDKFNSYSSGGIGFRTNQTAAWYTQVEHKSITSSEQDSTLSVTSGSWSTNYSPAISYYSAHWADSKATLDGGDSSFADLEFTAHVRVVREDDTSDAGLIFRATDLGTGSNALKGYYVGLDSCRNLLMLGKLNNNWTGLSSISMDIASDQYYKITVKAEGNNIEVYVNDVLKIDYTDNNNPYISGTIGFRAKNTTAYFNQVFYEKNSSISNNADLSTLVVEGHSLSPTFSPETTHYSVSVANSVTSVNITASPSQEGASVSGTGQKTLSSGVNTFQIVVTAESGITKTYTVEVTRRSNDANLSSLKVGGNPGYTLSPSFNPGITTYYVSVPFTDSRTEIIATPSSDSATVTGTGYQNLSPGINVHEIIVTAEDGNTKVYTVRIRKGYAATINNYYDNAQSWYYTSASTINTYNQTAAQKFYQMFGLVITSNDPVLFTSPGDECERTGKPTSLCTIHTPSCTDLATLQADTEAKFSSTNTPNIIWSGHTTKWGDNIDRCCSSGSHVYMLDRNTNSNITIGLLVHELSHQFGANIDHYHQLKWNAELELYECENREYCWFCATASMSRPKYCIMGMDYDEYKDVPATRGSLLFCPDCRNEIYAYLEARY